MNKCTLFMLPVLLAAFLVSGCDSAGSSKNAKNQVVRLDRDAENMLINDTAGFWNTATYEIHNQSSGDGSVVVNFDTLPVYINRPHIKRELLDSLKPHEADGYMPSKSLYQNNDSGFVFFLKDVFGSVTLLAPDLFSIKDSLIQIFRAGNMFVPRGTSTYVYRFANEDTEHYLTLSITLSFGSKGKRIGPVKHTVFYGGGSSTVTGSAYVFRAAYRCEISHLIVSDNKLNAAKGYRSIKHNHFPEKNCLYFKSEEKSKTQYLQNPSLALTSSPSYYKAKE